MIIDYGFTLIGKSHVAKGSCCQDYHLVKRLENGWYIAAVADGVGSAKNSGVGSQIAVETVVSVCEEYMPWDYNIISIKSMMRTAYNYAFKSIIRESQKTGESIESYDTTLTMVIYDGHKIIYGHSGDGAIIGLNLYGEYISITQPQKGVDGVSVIPLRSGYTKWKIDAYEEELAAVLLVTDGLLENIFCPYLLRLIEDEKPKGTNRVYVPIATFFADPVGFLDDQTSVDDCKEILCDYLQGKDSYNAEEFYSRLEKIYRNILDRDSDELVNEIRTNNFPVVLMQGVQDDKTIVGLINTESIIERKEDKYYKEPRWNELQELWNKMAYPHLYKDSNDTEEKQPSKKTVSDEDVLSSDNSNDAMQPSMDTDNQVDELSDNDGSEKKGLMGIIGGLFS